VKNLTPGYLREQFQKFTKETPGKKMTSCCPSAGLQLAKGLLPFVEQKCTITYQRISETRKVLAFLKREFLKIFLIHRCYFIIEMP